MLEKTHLSLKNLRKKHFSSSDLKDSGLLSLNFCISSFKKCSNKFHNCCAIMIAIGQKNSLQVIRDLNVFGSLLEIAKSFEALGTKSDEKESRFSWVSQKVWVFAIWQVFFLTIFYLFCHNHSAMTRFTKTYDSVPFCIFQDPVKLILTPFWKNLRSWTSKISR